MHNFNIQSVQIQPAIKISTVPLQAVAVKIQLVNPLDDIVTFQAVLEGEGLLGDTEFTLAPRETATYELVYSPLIGGRTKGQAVFINEKVGEFWYDLDLNALPGAPIVLDRFKCELGSSAVKTVTIENPVGREVVLKQKSSNKTNFRLTSQRVVMMPYETMELEVEYSPSSVNKVEVRWGGRGP
jgi:hypothetical protein